MKEMLRAILYNKHLAEVLDANVYISRLNKNPKQGVLGLQTTHCSSELQKKLTGEGQIFEHEEKAFVDEMSAALIDKEMHKITDLCQFANE